MRSSKSRSRNKNNRQRTLGNIVNRVFDSSGPEGKVRGTPQQIIEKYLTLARDAQLSNDRVAEQSFLQHAEHYTRLLSEAQREMAERQQYSQQQPNHRQNGDDDRDGENNGRDNGYRENNGRDYSPRQQDREEQNSTQDESESSQDSDRNVQPGEQSQQEQPRRARQQRRPKNEGDNEPSSQPSAAQYESADLGLPAAYAPEEEEESGPVVTPETSSGPKPRSRAPRSTSAAPRGRKKKDAEGEAANATQEVSTEDNS